jgi:hypothetical protein
MAIKKEIEVNVKTDSAVKNVENLNKSINQTSKEASDLKNNMGTASGMVDKATGGMVSKFQSVTKTIGGVSKGFGALRGAIIATGLGALLVIVTSLIEYFKNFEGGVKIVTTITNLFADTIAAIVDNASKLLTLDFAGFFGGVKDAMVESVNATNDLFDAQEKLYELNKKFIVENATLNADIEKQGRIVRDTTKSFEERLNAQKELDRLAEVLIKNEKELNEAELVRLKTELRLENNYEKRRELEIAIEQTMAGLINVESKLAAQRDKASKSERQMIEDQQKQREDDIKKRQEAAQKIRETRIAEQKAILAIETNFKKQIEDLEDTTEIKRLERAKARQLADIEQLKGTEADKQKARLQIEEFYQLKEKELAQKKKNEDEKLETEKQIKIDQIRAEFDIKRKELEATTEQQKFDLELEKIERERVAKENELIALGVDAESRLEILKSFELRKSQITDAFRQSEIDKEKILQEQRLSLVSNTFGKMANMFEQNSKAGKAFAIAQALINTYQGITAELATKTATPFEFGIKLANIASTAAIGFKAVKNILKTKPNSGASVSPISEGGGGGASAPTPQFNVVGNTGVNQLAQTLNTQQPIEAFVVASNVTSAQSINRNIVQNASLG